MYKYVLLHIIQPYVLLSKLCHPYMQSLINLIWFFYILYVYTVYLSFFLFIFDVYIAEYIVRETSEGHNVIGYIATEYEGIICVAHVFYCVEGFTCV